MRKLFLPLFFLFIINFITAQEPVDSSEFKVVEVMPEFPGGVDSMLNFIYRNIKYPPIARENGVEGVGVVTFVVEKDGSISEEKVLRDLGAGIGKEMLRVVRMFPKWSPGTQDGKPVRVQFNLPVKFALEDSEWQKNSGVSVSAGAFHANTNGELNNYFSSSTGGTVGFNLFLNKLRFELEIGFSKSEVKQAFSLNGNPWDPSDKVNFFMGNFGLGYDLPISDNQHLIPYVFLSTTSQINHSINDDEPLSFDYVGPGLGLHYELLLGETKRFGSRLLRLKTYWLPTNYTDIINGQTFVIGVDFGFRG